MGRTAWGRAPRHRMPGRWVRACDRALSCGRHARARTFCHPAHLPLAATCAFIPATDEMTDSRSNESEAGPAGRESGTSAPSAVRADWPPSAPSGIALPPSDVSDDAGNRQCTCLLTFGPRPMRATSWSASRSSWFASRMSLRSQLSSICRSMARAAQLDGRVTSTTSVADGISRREPDECSLAILIASPWG